MPIRIAVLASGGGSNLQSILDYQAAQGSNAAGRVVAVASDRRAAGALERARNAGIPAEYIGTGEGGLPLLDVLQKHDAQLVVLAGYLKLIPADVTSRYKGRIVNIHPGPLPEFGGAGMYGIKVHESVIAAKARETAVTVHFVDDEYDHGDVIAKWPVPVNPDDTPQSLAERVLAVEHIVYPRIIDIVSNIISIKV